MNIDIEKVEAEARAQIEKESFEEAVKEKIEKIKRKRPVMEVLFPWTITITRKESK